jgi:flagellar biosynthesis protein FlhG
MNDQASALRSASARAVMSPHADEARALVVGGGKGGTGVSVLSVLLASAMARQGRRVLLMDATLNQGNLHLLLGCPPGPTLRTLLAGEASPQDLVIPVAERLWLLPSESGAEAVHALTPMDRARLHVRLAALMDDYDMTVVDAGTGIDSVLRAALARASRLVAVTTAEPASLADTYALVKILSIEAPALPVDVLVNRVQHEDEAVTAYQRINTAAQHFLGRGLGSLGSVREDARVRRAVRGERPLTALDGRVAPIAKQLLAMLEMQAAGGRCSS